jgi:enoyl-[acyl-carrier protein] reductase II
VRALKNKASEEFGRLQLELIQLLNEGKLGHAEAQYRVESFWMGGLRKAAVDGDVERGSCMAGQSVGLVDKVQPMAEIFAELIGDAEAELEAVKARLAALPD